MELPSPVLMGTHVRLEPLTRQHVPALAAAIREGDPALYRWTIVPRDEAGMHAYVDTALAWQAAGTAVPLATVRLRDGAVVGCTRYFDLERWDWPADHARHGRAEPDVGEIGYTWLAASTLRTPVNTEAKLLMLTQAFEAWGMLRICLQTHSKNARSRAAIERLGAKFDGLIRVNKLMPDGTPRDSARYSITAEEWPEVKARLQGFLRR